MFPTKPPELNSAIGTSSKMNCCPTNSPSSNGSTVTPGALLGNGASLPSRSWTFCPVRSRSSFWTPNTTVPLTVLSELIPRFMFSLMHPVIRKTSATNAPIRPAVRARRDILEPPVVGIPGRLPRGVGRGEPVQEDSASTTYSSRKDRYRYSSKVPSVSGSPAKSAGVASSVTASRTPRTSRTSFSAASHAISSSSVR